MLLGYCLTGGESHKYHGGEKMDSLFILNVNFWKKVNVHAVLSKKLKCLDVYICKPPLIFSFIN